MRRPRSERIGRIVALAVAAVLCAVFSPLTAQLQSGALYGTVTDSDGSPLTGVEVSLSGVGARQLQKTNDKGQMRFLGLDPGTYTIEAEFEGFSKIVYESIQIRVGRNTTLQMQMSSVLEETITVTTEPPSLGTGRTASGISVNEFELDEIPTTRDPWAIVSQAPGVIMDRVNVGGSESGQQAVFIGHGSPSSENAYIVDGVNITDMAAIGATPAYFDFDQLGEMQVTVGGADATIGTSGVTVNLVTKRGTNQLVGSSRLFYTGERLQSSPNIDPDDFAPGQKESPTNQIRGITEYGAELGGRLINDRLWFWGAYAFNDIDRMALGGSPDDIDLQNAALKLNSQLSRANSAVVAVNRSDKDRFGRGASPSRSWSSQWDQQGRVDFYKIEDSQLFASNLYIGALFSSLTGDFELQPKGGPDAEIILGADGVWRGSFVQIDDNRDARQWRIDGANFGTWGPTGHEIEFELGSRRFDYGASESWGPRDLINIATENVDGKYNLVEVFRPGTIAVKQTYHVLWAQDTITRDRLTLNAGLRFDRQQADNLATEAGANPAFPHLLPPFAVPAADAGFSWDLLSPRLGVTYSVSPQTILRSSYARYASQLQTDLAARISPEYSASAILSFEDLDGDDIYDPAEPVELLSSFGVDPDDPSARISRNINDRDLDPEITDELVVAFEHTPRTELVLGLDLTYRTVSGILEGRRLIRDASDQERVVSREDYVLDSEHHGVLPDGESFDVPVFSLDEDYRYTGGRLLTNGDREQHYLGASLSLTRRLVNGWMVRGHVTLSDWTWDLGPEFVRFDDPTDLAISFAEDGLINAGDSDGEIVAEPFRGQSEGVFLNSRWSFNVASLYQVAPRKSWGFNAAINLHGREGFPGPYRIVVTPADGLEREVQVTSRGDSFRYDNVILTDLRLEKSLFENRLGAMLSVDIFNLFNSGIVLERGVGLNGPQPNYLLQTLSPRVIRFGVRLQWN